MALAMYGGLLRLGVPLPHVAPLDSIHGPLMICGVFGTLISLERATAIGLSWPYVAPSSFALSAVVMVAGGPLDLAAALAVLGAGAFVLASIWILVRQPALFTGVLLLAVSMLLVGCALWLTGTEVRDLVAWWLGFLVLTIAAERLELSRVIPQTRGAQMAFVAAVALVVVGAVPGLEHEWGGRLVGAGFVAMTAWLARHDMATRTARMTGQPRFMATAMLVGYGWLGAVGVGLAVRVAGPFAYDLALHGVLIGFVLSMVFGHALIIFPALTGMPLRYGPALYAPLGLLHLSVALRVAGGLVEAAPVRLASGPLTLAALVLFAITLAMGRRRSP